MTLISVYFGLLEERIQQIVLRKERAEVASGLSATWWVLKTRSTGNGTR